jgi:hypothetical protein
MYCQHIFIAIKVVFSKDVLLIIGTYELVIWAV